MIARWLVVIAISACTNTRGNEARRVDPTPTPTPTTTATPDAAAPSASPDVATVRSAPGGTQLQPAEQDIKPAPGRDFGAELDSVAGTKPQLGSATGSGHSKFAVTSHKVLDSSSVSPNAVVADVMRKHGRAVLQCYDAERTRDAKAAGTVTLRFAVTKPGAVEQPTADSWSPALSDCVRGAMAAWKFPAASARARFEIVLTLAQ